MPAGTRFRVLGAVAATVAAVVWAFPRPAAGQFTLAEGEAATVTVGGYVRSITGFHDLGYDPPALPIGPAAPERESGFHGEVIRLKWLVDGGGWRLELHDRVQARITSEAGGASILGFGVSAVPDRLVDLRSTLVRRDRLAAWHDVDRLSLSLFTDAVDLTVGRQAITWGTSTLFPVADLWAQFSPFELETEEKPGLDAVRALAYPADGLELDAVIAHRGSAADLSVGIRGTLGLSGLDVWAGAGKFWREAIAMGGVTVLFDEAKLRAEAVLPWSLDGDRPLEPRATLGVDWIRGSLTLTGEYHLNGIGSTDPAAYLETAADERFQRGETYFLGRHYLGGVVSWSPDEENRLMLVLNGLANLGDGSVVLTPLATYDLGQSARLGIGGLLGLGSAPRVTLLPPDLELESEFGTYGRMLFTTLSLYF